MLNYVKILINYRRMKSMMFNKHDKEFLLYGFEEFCIEKEQLRSQTVTTYLRIMEVYFDQVIINKIHNNDYVGLFDEKNLMQIRSIIKNNALRATFLNFLDFLKDADFLDDDYEVFQINQKITNILTGENKKAERNVEILTPKEVKNLFEGKFDYKTIEEEIVAPLIVALSFFCMFKQNEIFKLKLSDVDLKKRSIRNMKYTENINMVEYIKVNDTLYRILQNYIEYRASLNTEFEELIIIQNKPINMNSLNKMLSVYKRVDNNSKLGNKNIHCEMLIRTMIHYQLQRNVDEALYNIFGIFKNMNEDIKSIFNQYIEDKRNENLNNYIQLIDVEELLPYSNKIQFEELKANKLNQLETSRSKENFEELFVEYSPEYDITINDLEDYELGNSRNQELNKVTIQRLVRNSTIADKLKEYYNFQCQLCNYQLRKSDGGFTAEAHHIQPYNKVHKGDDTTKNLIILCPNCHTQFDDLYFAIEPETHLVHCIFEDDDYHLTQLILKHKLDEKYLKYTWQLFQQKKDKIL